MSAPLVQPPSASLAALVSQNQRLHVTALPSGAGTAAIGLIEDSAPHHRWGELIIPGERQIYRAFAANPSLGATLVIVDDVRILLRTDPVPPTAYRWTRPEVELYARCGIPDRTIDECTKAFFASAQSILLTGGANPSQ